MDESVKDEVKEKVEEEMKSIDTNKTHPYVLEKYPKVSTSHPLKLGTNSGKKLVDRYKNLQSDDEFSSEDKLKILGSYTMMRSRNLKMLNRNRMIVENGWLIKNDQLEQMNATVDKQISDRKRQIEQVFDSRKRKCLEFKPVEEFLSNRWDEKIDELIGIGIEKMGETM